MVGRLLIVPRFVTQYSNAGQSLLVCEARVAMARGNIRQRSKKNKDSYIVYIYLGVDPVTG